jgi:hypothetical protein
MLCPHCSARLVPRLGWVQGDWEAGIPLGVLESVRVKDYEGAMREGAEIVQDCHPAHAMSWPSVEAFWEVSCGGDSACGRSTSGSSSTSSSKLLLLRDR